MLEGEIRTGVFTVMASTQASELLGVSVVVAQVTAAHFNSVHHGLRIDFLNW